MSYLVLLFFGPFVCFSLLLLVFTLIAAVLCVLWPFAVFVTYCMIVSLSMGLFVLTNFGVFGVCSCSRPLCLLRCLTCWLHRCFRFGLVFRALPPVLALTPLDPTNRIFPRIGCKMVSSFFSYVVQVATVVLVDRKGYLKCWVIRQQLQVLATICQRLLKMRLCDIFFFVITVFPCALRWEQLVFFGVTCPARKPCVHFVPDDNSLAQV